MSANVNIKGSKRRQIEARPDETWQLIREVNRLNLESTKLLAEAELYNSRRLHADAQHPWRNFVIPFGIAFSLVIGVSALTILLIKLAV